MASIVPKTLGTGKRAYLVRYRTPNGQQRSRQFDRKGDAERFARNIETDKDRGDFVDPKAGKVTLQQWWDEWYPGASVKLADNTKDRDRRTFANHVAPTFGNTALSRLDHLAVSKWVADLSDKLAPESVQKCHQTLRKALQGAVRAGRIRYNPADDVALPKIVRSAKRVLNRDEVEALADAVDPRYRLFVWLAAYCGLREGEIAGLTWGAIDTDKGWLHVRQQVTEVAGVQKVTTELKSKAANRKVPVPAFLCDVLRIDRDNATDSAFVVPNSDGGPLRCNAFRSRYFVPACTKAGVGKVTPHELRHSCVTRWVDQGANPVQVKTWAGHRSVATILDLYAHHEDGAAEAVRERMDSYATGNA